MNLSIQCTKLARTPSPVSRSQPHPPQPRFLILRVDPTALSPCHAIPYFCHIPCMEPLSSRSRRNTVFTANSFHPKTPNVYFRETGTFVICRQYRIPIPLRFQRRGTGKEKADEGTFRGDRLTTVGRKELCLSFETGRRSPLSCRTNFCRTSLSIRKKVKS